MCLFHQGKEGEKQIELPSCSILLKMHPFSISSQSQVKALSENKKNSTDALLRSNTWLVMSPAGEKWWFHSAVLAPLWRFLSENPVAIPFRTRLRGRSCTKVLLELDELGRVIGAEFWETEHLTFEMRRVFMNRTVVACGFRQKWLVLYEGFKKEKSTINIKDMLDLKACKCYKYLSNILLFF